MIIVITAEQHVYHESYWINLMFEAGLKLLHIRKYAFSDKEMSLFVQEIALPYRNRLVLHSHHHLAEDLGINRLHFNENDRKSNKQDQYDQDIIRSTSVHSIDVFNTLDSHWSYALFSPMFSSISKANHGKTDSVKHELASRNNLQVQLIGLAGIHAENMGTLYAAGVDGVALLGTIWKNEQPLISLKKCLQKDLTYSA